MFTQIGQANIKNTDRIWNSFLSQSIPFKKPPLSVLNQVVFLLQANMCVAADQIFAFSPAASEKPGKQHYKSKRNCQRRNSTTEEMNKSCCNGSLRFLVLRNHCRFQKKPPKPRYWPCQYEESILRIGKGERERCSKWVLYKKLPDCFHAA